MWVIGTDAEHVIEFRPEVSSPAPTTPIDALPARAAEHLFWLGRYAERAEATVRLIRTINARRDEFDQAPPGPGPASLTVLLEALDADHGYLSRLRRRRRAGAPRRPDRRAVVTRGR